VEAHSFVYGFTSNYNEADRSTDKWWKTRRVLLNKAGIAALMEGLAYPSFRLSPTGAGLTDILGWVEMELCDWLAKDEVSKLMGDVGGVGLLHSECERDPGVEEEKGKNSDLMCTAVILSIRRSSCKTQAYLYQIQWRADNELGLS